MNQQEELNTLDLVIKEFEEDLIKSRQELEEITLMLEQSKLEVNKLTQRNAKITSRLQQIHSQFESLPREDIRLAYDSALDAQQRLFVMRGQLEKLQGDQSHQKRYVTLLERIVELLKEDVIGGTNGKVGDSTSERVEMMIQAQEAERQRLSRKMHDGPAQALSNFILQTEIAMRLFDLDQEKAKEELSNLKISATSTFQKVRDFIFDLRPMMLDDLGLAPTLRRYVDAHKNQSNIDVRLTITGIERRQEPYLEVMVFRAIQELISNATRHSQATRINVQLDMAETQIKVVVEDNGKGFDKSVLDDRKNMGLRVIRERVELLGGYMEIDSVLGQGTRITFQTPAADASTFA